MISFPLPNDGTVEKRLFPLGTRIDTKNLIFFSSKISNIRRKTNQEKEGRSKLKARAGLGKKCRDQYGPQFRRVISTLHL